MKGVLKLTLLPDAVIPTRSSGGIPFLCKLNFSESNATVDGKMPSLWCIVAWWEHKTHVSFERTCCEYLWQEQSLQ
jgi:hypothetical protein